jgi:hypothetical protein
VTALITFILQVVTAAQPIVHGEHTRFTIADGSVWAEVLNDGDVRLTQRLCDADPATRWLISDVDGDGREDLVAIRLDVGGAHLTLWRNGTQGFTRGLASYIVAGGALGSQEVPRLALALHFVRPFAHALRELFACLLGLTLPLA